MNEEKKEKRIPTTKEMNARFQAENQAARKYMEEDTKAIAEEIIRLSENACSIIEIVAELYFFKGYRITEKIYYDLVERYEPVSVAHELAGKRIASKAWKLGNEGKGHNNILQMAIKRHDKRHGKIERAIDFEDFKAKEITKTDEKIRAQKALVDDNKEAIQDAVALAAEAIQKINSQVKQGESIDIAIEE